MNVTKGFQPKWWDVTHDPYAKFDAKPNSGIEIDLGPPWDQLGPAFGAKIVYNIII